MNTIDLFKSQYEKSLHEGAVDTVNEQQDDVPVPVNLNDFRTPENITLVKKIWAQIQQYVLDDEAGWLTLEWPNQPAATVSRNQAWTIVNRLAKMPKQKRNVLILTTFGSRNAFLTWLNSLKIMVRPAPKKETPKGQMSLDLKEKAEKKSSSDSDYKDVAVQRAMTRARADYPTAASDAEAFAKSMLDQQEQDSKNINQLKQKYRQQKDLLNRNQDLDQDQQQTIQSIEKEIDRVEQDNVNLGQMVQRMQSVNTALQQTLARMQGRAPVAEPAVGVSVATDKPVAEPATTKPARDQRLVQYAKRLRQQIRNLELQMALKQPEDQTALQQQIDQLQGQLAQIQQPRLPEPTPQIRSAKPATVGGRDAEILPARGKDEEDDDIGSISSDVEALLKGISTASRKKKRKKATAEVSEEVTSIPRKMVIQGYTVEYDPVQRLVTVSRRGRVVGRAVNKPGSYNNYQVVANRIIDASEEDKYPDDLEARSVERPFGESQEELTAQDILFRTAAKAMYDANQQGIDIDYEEAIKIASKLMRIPYAPSMLPALQAQLADVEKKIATLKSVKRAKKQREKEKLTHQTTADEERRAAEWMKNYGNALQRRLQTRQTEDLTHGLEESQSSEAYVKGGRDGYYDRPKNNPYEPGTEEHREYNRGYNEFKDNGKDYLRELEKDRSGQPMYQQEEVYMLTHDGKEIAFYRLKDLKRAEQDAREMQKKLGGEVHIRKVMREGNEWDMTDAEFYRDLLAVLSIPVGIMTAAVYSKVKNTLNKYRAIQVMKALDKKNVVLSREDVQRLRGLLDEFDQLIAKNDGTNARRVAQEIQTLASQSKAVNEGDVVRVDFRQGADAEAVRAFKEKRADYFDKIAKADPESAKRLRAELQDLEDAARRRGLIREGRAGYGPLLNAKHWHEVEQHLFKIINDPNVDDQTRAEAKQRWLDKQREAKLKGFKE